MGAISPARKIEGHPKTKQFAVFYYVFGVSTGKPDNCTEMVEVTTAFKLKSNGTSEGKPSNCTNERVLGSTKAPASAVGAATPSDQPTAHSRVVPATYNSCSKTWLASDGSKLMVNDAVPGVAKPAS